MLLSPVWWREVATPQQRQKAKEIVQEYGRYSLARFTLLNDKTYSFSGRERSIILYVPKGRGAIALGDQIGRIEDRREILTEFQAFCDRNDWYGAFSQTLPKKMGC